MKISRLIGLLSRYSLKRWPALIAVIGSIVLKAAADALKPWPTLIIVDHILYHRPITGTLQRVLGLAPQMTDRQLIAWTIVSTIVLFLLSWALGVANSYANVVFSQRLVYDLAGDLFSHLQRLSLGFHSRRSVGDSIRRVTTDCASVAGIVKDAIFPGLSALLSLVLMFGIMWNLDWSLTLAAVAVIPLMMLTLRLYAQPMLDRSYRQQEVESGIYEVSERTLGAIPIVQVFRGEARAMAQFRNTGNESTAAALSTTSLQLQFNTLIGIATALGTAAILWLGGYRALHGTITVGGILVFLSYLASLYGPLESVMYAPSSFQLAAGSAVRVMELLDTEHDVREQPNAHAIPRSQGRVTFENVTFGYDQSRPVLRELSLDIRPGETLAIVGGTGAGKSTLASLVPRLFDPWSGTVRIDGHDLKSITLASLRDQIALVLQEPFLFPLTIAANIAYGRPAATLEQIHDAARAANAHDFIANLPQGYDTIIGERGITLSGGERQRLSIARALLRDAPILILDEPTSALDAATEQSVLEALRRLMQGRTTLMIAHRLSTVRQADRIIVLDHGQILEQGSHEQLLQLGGGYARLYYAFHGRGTNSDPAEATS